jgi:hypothetical protein
VISSILAAVFVVVVVVAVVVAVAVIVTERLEKEEYILPEDGDRWMLRINHAVGGWNTAAIHLSQHERRSIMLTCTQPWLSSLSSSSPSHFNNTCML